MVVVFFFLVFGVGLLLLWLPRFASVFVVISGRIQRLSSLSLELFCCWASRSSSKLRFSSWILAERARRRGVPKEGGGGASISVFFSPRSKSAAFNLINVFNSFGVIFCNFSIFVCVCVYNVLDFEMVGKFKECREQKVEKEEQRKEHVVGRYLEASISRHRSQNDFDSLNYNYIWLRE